MAAKGNNPLVVGVSVRLPGARSLSAMWNVLASGRCTIGEVSDRFFDHARFYDPHINRRGRSYSLASGQIDDIFHFDPAFFGISPRAALQLDPQQRLILQGTWQAVEDAGLSIEDLAGERTGVFVGSSLVENLSLYYYDAQRTDSAFALGNELSIVANRVSSTFDFRGPSYVVDTACSSGLYALHQAAEALRRGELDTAVVGAVHMARTPGGYVGFSHAKMLSQSGICRAFDAGADGYVRGEAAVVVILQRAKIAKQLGARQRAQLLASGVNSDGKTSSITVPSIAQQQNLIEKLFDETGRDPDDLAFYEAHGTGTPVGDPIEAASIGRALAQLRRQTLMIGSAKTNFGHSEPAAGLVGLAKSLLSIENRSIAPSLNFSVPNPHIDFDGLNLAVNTQLHALPDTGPLLVGVNSFGFGGTNAAAFVESLDPVPRRVFASQLPLAKERQKTQPWLLLSAASERSLSALAHAWAQHLRQAQSLSSAWQELAAAQAARPALSERLALPLSSDAPERLEQFAAHGPEKMADLLRGSYPRGGARHLFLFPGNGVQILFMGRQEYDAEPLFARHYDVVAAAFLQQGGPDLHALMRDPELLSKLGAPLVAQPLLFGYQYALSRYLQDCGIHADAVLGHSVGEIAALNFAGALTLHDAVHLIISRSRAFETIRKQGGMAVLAVNAEDAASIIELSGCDDIEIAAVNSPKSVTVVGSEASLDTLSQFRFSGKRIPFLRLSVEIPYHSKAVDRLKDVFDEALKQITFTPPKIEVVSPVTGRVLTARDCTLDYFWKNARLPVLFSEALTCFGKQGAAIGIEIGPKPSLMANVRDITKLNTLAIDYFSPTADLRAGAAETGLDIRAILAKAWTGGVRVDPVALTGPRVVPAPDLPAYPWDEQEYQSTMSLNALDAWGEGSPRWLTGIRAERASGVWMAEFTPSFPSWVDDHRVGDSAVLPAAALIDMALGVMREVEPDADILLEHFDITGAARINGDGLRLRTTFDRATGELIIEQRPLLTDVAWSAVAKGRLRRMLAKQSVLHAKPRGLAQDTALLYEEIAKLGLHYGPTFKRLKSARLAGRDTIWVELLPPQVEGKFSIDFMGLDAALHSLGLTAIGLVRPKQTLGSHALVPVRFEAVELLQKDTAIASASLQVKRRRQRSLQVDVILYAADGRAVIKMRGLELSTMRLSRGSDCALERVSETSYKLRLRGAPVQLAPKWDRPHTVFGRLGFSPNRPPLSMIEARINTLRSAVEAGESDAMVAAKMADILQYEPDFAPDLRDLWRRLKGEEPVGVRQYGLSHRLMREATIRLAKAYIKDWPKDQRLNILIVGEPDHVLLQQLQEHGGFDRLLLSLALGDEESRAAALIGRQAGPFLRKGTEPKGEYDLIICTGLSGDLKQAESALAPRGVLVSLSYPALQTQPQVEDNVYYAQTGELTLALSMHRGQAAEDDLVLPAYDCLLHDYQGVGSLCEELSAILVKLRHQYLQDGPALIVFLRDHSGGTAYFSALAAGVAAGLRVWRNENSAREVGLVVLHEPSLTPEQDEAASWVEAALERQVVHINTGMATTKGFIKLAEAKGSAQWILSQEDHGSIDRLSWQPAVPARLREGEVEIDVEEVGLNFRDVMLARGMLPERLLDFGHSDGFGMECVGRVRRVGAGVDSYPIGARVMTLASGAFANRVVVPARGLIPCGDLGAASAAAIPVAYLTAWHALVTVARLQPGESVLIHGAAGGVGLAALQVAKHLGARIFATAGAPDKRLLALAYGADVVFDSRDLGFAEAIKRHTDGRGVDVVLNSLSGDAMRASFESVAPFGRFVELGKRDFIEANLLNLRHFLRNITYFAVDLDQYVAHKPQEAILALQDVVQKVQHGEFRRLPVVTYPPEEVSLAYQKMLKAGHVGKVVVSPPTSRAARTVQASIRGTWVLLGGTGGIGLMLAQRLLSEGAAAVHLISRGGVGSVLDAAQRAWIEATPSLHCHMLDASDAPALSRFFEGLTQEGIAIEGVVHCAMLLRDRMIRDLNHDEMEMVLRSKVGVAEALNEALHAADQHPAHVVLFSSISALIGTSGQFGYAAANAALLEMAQIWRVNGLPALAIGWGPVADAGYLVHDHALAKRLSRQQGLRLLTAQELGDEFFAALNAGSNQSYVFSAQNWNALASDLPAVAGRPFDGLLNERPTRRQAGVELSTLLKGLSDKEALDIITVKVREILSRVLGGSAEGIALNTPLVRSGVDSLMAVELRLEIESQIGCSLPVSVITPDVTAMSLSVELLKLVRGGEET